MSKAVERLDHLNLVTRLCEELERSMGTGDRDLAEYIITLADKSGSRDAFVNTMTEEMGGMCDTALIQYLWSVIESTRRSQGRSVGSGASRGAASGGGGGGGGSVGDKDGGEPGKAAFPGLAIPDDEDAPAVVDGGSRRRDRGDFEAGSGEMGSAPDAKRRMREAGVGMAGVGGSAGGPVSNPTLPGSDGSSGGVPGTYGAVMAASEATKSTVGALESSGVSLTSSVLSGGRARKELSTQERYEMQRLVASGVLPASAVMSDDEEEEGGGDAMTVDIVEREPPFLRGQTSATRELSPVRVVKNPDGSLARAAQAQAEFVKEKREVKAIRHKEMVEAAPRDLGQAWADPMASRADRHLAVDLAGLSMVKADEDEPEWKRKSIGTSVALGKTSKLSIREQRIGLPIYKMKDDFINAVRDNQVIVVLGETGSGKTTQMPQYLAEAGFTSKGIVACTQPRRVAAMSVAERVSEEVGCRVGEEVGYSIRFEDKTSPTTKIKFMTDGMLLREYLADRSLSRYSVIILDEAHERTINTDVLFGLMYRLLQKRRDLRVICTSATLDAEKFSSFFFDCPIFKIPGRMFPVRTYHATEPADDYVELAVRTAMKLHVTEPAGDILVFLTGEEEINTACEMLYERVTAMGKDVPELVILPAYAALPSEMQSRIFDPAPAGARKCIVATNIAEASLTIDGILYVIDPGFTKQKVFDPKLGMDSLQVVPISQASAKQREGRAGRTAPGKCYRLYTKDAFDHEMLPMSVPEIKRSNLAAVVLQLKAMGINDLEHFPFMDPPPHQVLVNALQRLYFLGALDDEGLLTRLGRRMAEFPLDPSLSKTLLTSVELGCSEEVLSVVAVLSVDTVFHRPRERQAAADQRHARFHQPEGDHVTCLEVFKAWEKARRSPAWCRDNFLHHRNLLKALEVRKQLVGIMDRHRLDIISCGRSYDLVRKAIVAGFFMNVARKTKDGYTTLLNDLPIFIHPGSSIFKRPPPLVLYNEIVVTSKEYMRGVMAIEDRWLVELAPRFFEKVDSSKMTRAKKHEKLEPLFDRFHGKDDWRLSKRRQ